MTEPSPTSITPELYTDRADLFPLSSRYITPESVAWLNDPEVMRFSEQRHHRHDEASSLRWLRGLIGAGHHAWAIVVRETQTHVGNIVAYVDRHNASADLSILIGNRGSQGRGVGSEAWQAVCGYLFAGEGIRKITAGTMSENASMRRLMEKTGMRRDGRRERHRLLEGREVDIVHAALFREDWEQQKKGSKEHLNGA